MKRLLIALVASVLPLASQAQNWPTRSVKFVVPLGPGGGADITGRMLAERLSKQWGQTVVVENRPGAEGVVAINAVLSAKDDHTFLYTPTGTFAAHPYTMQKMPYDPKDLVPVARVSNTVVALAVPASSSVKSLKELIDQARAQPGKLNWTSVTSVYDMQINAWLKGAGVEMARVPYKDPVSALNDLVENRIQLYSAAYAIMRTQVQAGRVRLLALHNRSRAPGIDAPTAGEAGYPQLVLDGLVGLLAARAGGVSDAVRERIAADVRTHSSDPQMAERMTATGQVVNPGSPAEFAAAMDEQSAALEAFARVLGLRRQ